MRLVQQGLLFAEGKKNLCRFALAKAARDSAGRMDEITDTGEEVRGRFSPLGTGMDLTISP